MTENKNFISVDELRPYLKESNNVLDYNNLVKALIKHQEDLLNGFELLIKNLKTLDKCQIQKIKIGSIVLNVMLNPVRKNSLLSSGFKDRLEKAQCKLCNLYPNQRGLPIINGKYIILINPMMVTRGDLTIATTEHYPQVIKGRFADMVYIAKTLSDFSIFYNGLLAGASNPHFHFQAGFKNMLPGEMQIENFLNNIEKYKVEKIIAKSNIQVLYIPDFLRKNIIVTSTSEDELTEFFDFFNNDFLDISKNIKNLNGVPDFGEYIDSIKMNELEGRMNLLLKYYPITKKYLLTIFPKVTNRPSLFYDKEPKRIILGMAIREYLGQIITIRSKDFQKLIFNPLLIEKAYQDTTLPDNLFYQLVQKLSEYQFF